MRLARRWKTQADRGSYRVDLTAARILNRFALVRSHISAAMSNTLLVLFLTIWTEIAAGFRGPHHPSGSISHHHYVPQNEVKLTQDAELLHDTAHLKEDMGAFADQLDLTKMTEQELEFHYFKLHDVDNNTKLDGLEILHAIQHTLHEDGEDEENKNEDNNEHRNDLHWIVELIDRVLEEDDLDNDGYLGYTEYVLGRQRDQSERGKRDKKLEIRK
ncbi:multiple coagulation factor deficiency protein 2 homolog [Cephus cinctus]|uniref:Multiple coagulation factor deficiency protein 2 homolog n=1 Tax=Cephus cinctus TaxID=211228 RepID=A0AAJ7BIW2_CEPCN|nr:multiple coagulation factor deficiency protein 2 homolog [Cephus cinctus]